MQTNRKNSFASLPKQHCPEDLSCRHCCQCWERFRKEFEVKINTFTTKLEKSSKENAFLSNLNRELKKNLDEVNKKLNKYKNIDELTSNIREELIQKINEEKAVQDTLVKEELMMLKEERKEKEKKIGWLEKNNEEYVIKIDNLDLQLNDLKNEHASMKEDYQNLVEYKKKNIEQLRQLNQNLSRCEQLLNDKTDLIEKQRISLIEMEGRFMQEKSKANSYSSSNEYLELNLKNKDKFIEQLTKCSETNLNSIKHLQFNNQELKDLVTVLDSEVIAGRANEEYFKHRLLCTNQMYLASEGMAKYNSDKVELMKNDLQLLKMTL